MLAIERRKKILDILNTQSAVSVSSLSSVLNVTEETVRRDLEKLEKNEELIRTHGGAVAIDKNLSEFSYQRRKNAFINEKMALAKEAAKNINAWDRIFLDASTTTYYISKEIKNISNLTVITNSLRIIEELYNSNIKVIGVGGILSENKSFVGSIAEDNIDNNFFANKMFFSAKGFTDNGLILEGGEEECGIKKKMLKNSKTKYFLCDKSKFGKVGHIKLTDVENVDVLITDKTFTEDEKKFFEDKNIKLTVI